MERIGLKDVPIERQDEEALGLKNYADVLTEFVAECDTPITVALQGDWGSGKTSLMNLMRESLDKDKEHYQTVWFNTWQYAQFNMADTLALSMMSYFIDRLDPSNGASAKAAKALLNLARAAAVGAASMVGQADTLNAALAEATRGGDGTDPSRHLAGLKDRIADIVAGKKEKKVVVFIDDIDRLVPVKAIELLEALKVFLDIDKCVYIIACDYSVVVTGLKEKFGVDEGELKGKSFFDKIIQVPFKMPIRRYKVDAYLQDLLQKINIDADETDVGMYRELIETSIGFNPRTMKRMFNSLVLLMILAKKEVNDWEGHDQRGRARVLFGVLCMQEKYEPLYDYIRRQKLSGDFFGRLQDGLEKEEEFEVLREAMEATSAEGEVDFERVVSFVEVFFRCLQLDEEMDDLSQNEIENLREVIGLSAVVSAGTEDVEIDAGSLVKRLRTDLNEKYRAHLGKKRPKIDKFRYSTHEVPEVYLWLPAELDGYFSICLGEERLEFGLYGSTEVQKHFKRELGLRNDDDERDYWYSTPSDSPSAEEDLREHLYGVLDKLLPRLYEICKSAPRE